MIRQRTTSRADRLFRACSDRTRLGILRILQRGETCVCDIVSELRVPQPTASRHLAYLRGAGLVEARKQGLWSYYRLTEPGDELHRALLACVSCCGEMTVNSRRNGKCNLRQCC
jgi:ArsR family transcriptional regulator